MTGHEQLKKMRLMGMKPQAVWVVDYQTQISRDWHAPRTLTGKPMEQHQPSVSIEPTDKINSLDMRFLVGLVVHVSSSEEKRAKALFKQCKAAGASIVIGCHTQDHKHYTDQSGWIEIFRGDDGIST